MRNLPQIILGVALMAHPLSAATHYVDANNSAPAAPYTSWATAANVIQDAIDAAAPGDEVVVTNGVYATGGKAISSTMTNRVAIDKPLFVHSVNGAGHSVIQGRQVPGTITGDGAIRCIYITNQAVLVGFTLTGGATQVTGGIPEQNGGGVFGAWNDSSAVVSNCVIVGNYANLGGGGSYLANLVNCLVISNSVPRVGYANGGGGVQGGNLTNCTIVGNTGAGAYSWRSGLSGVVCAVFNSIVLYNENGNSETSSTYYSCTTTNLFSPGANNIDADPQFVNPALGDFRLKSSSPCINAGNNGYSPGGLDLAGNPRIVAGIVDMGAFEFAMPSLRIVLTGPNVLIFWPLWASSYELQEVSSLGGTWINTSGTPSIAGGEYMLTVPVAGAAKFYRLHLP